MAGKPKANYKSDPNVSSEKDRCQTPSYALLPLLEPLARLKQATMDKTLIIWEPAQGAGLLAAELAKAGTVVGGDLTTGQNYFEESSVPAWYDVQVTNPPYGQRVKYRWIRYAYQRRKPWALLMPWETWAAKQAMTVFEKFGIEVIMFDERIDFIMPDKGYTKGGANYPSAWFTFGLNLGKTITYGKIGAAKAEYEYQMEKYQYERLQPSLFELTGAT